MKEPIKSYYNNGQLQREGYWIDGKVYSKHDYYKEIHKKGLISDEGLFRKLL